MAQSRGRTPLHAAARVGTPVQMSELLAAAGDGAAHAVNAQDNVGMTPLMVAAKALNVEHCLLLLAVDGLDANLADTAGRTALHYVCAARPSSANDLAPYTEVLEALFDRGAEATPDSKGWMPLHVACDAGNYTAVAAILQSAPDGVSVGTVRSTKKKKLRFFFFFFFFFFFLLTAFFFVATWLAPASLCRQVESCRIDSNALAARRRRFEPVYA
jgi:ankyrin repeat protein